MTRKRALVLINKTAGISDLFEELMYEYIKKVESGEIKPHKSYNLEKGNTNKKKKCCS